MPAIATNQSLLPLWQQALELIQTEMSSLSFKTWIRPLEPISFDNGTLCLYASNHIMLNYAKNFQPLIQSALETITSKAVHVEIHETIQDALSSTEKSFISPTSYDKTIHVKPNQADSFFSTKNPSNEEKPSIASKYTFDQFVVGSGNQYAHAACLALAEQPNHNVNNPLFLYGGSGLGKTHLMHAIGNHIRLHHPEKKLLYMQCERFVNEFIHTISQNTFTSFREKFRNCDILMIDDIQFIEKKEQTQIEFFNTYNALYEQGSIIVLTCDKPPSSLTELTDRLRTRFASGLIVDIQPPDYETRVAIVKKHCENEQVELPPAVIQFIVEHVDSSIRELEGICNSAVHYIKLCKHADATSCIKFLRNIINPTQKSKVTADIIVNVVSNYFSITPQEMKSKKRSNNIVVPRSVAMYFMRNILDMTFEQIGHFFNKHHTTVMHNYSELLEKIKEDPKIQSDINTIKQSLMPQG